MRAEKRMHRRGKERCLTIYAVFLAMLALALVLIPYVSNPVVTSRVPVIVLAGVMWIGFVGTLCTAACITARRRRDRNFRVRGPAVQYWGLIHFFKNGRALVADGAMLLSLAVLVLAATGVVSVENAWFFAFLGVFVYAFGMHCMLNGLNYLYINQNRKKEGTCHEESQEIQ